MNMSRSVGKAPYPNGNLLKIIFGWDAWRIHRALQSYGLIIVRVVPLRKL